MEILQTYNVIDVPDGPSFLLKLLACLVIISFLLVIINLFCKEWSSALGSTIACVLLIVVFSFVMHSCEESYTKERYLVKVDDSITVQEFYREWEVIEEKSESLFVVERKGEVYNANS